MRIDQHRILPQMPAKKCPSAFRDMNGNTIEPVEEETIFAVLNKDKARGGSSGPIVDTYETRGAAKKGSQAIKNSIIVELKYYREWKRGDHPNLRSDAIIRQEPTPTWRH